MPVIAHGRRACMHAAAVAACTVLFPCRLTMTVVTLLSMAPRLMTLPSPSSMPTSSGKYSFELKDSHSRRVPFTAARRRTPVAMAGP